MTIQPDHIVFDDTERAAARTEYEIAMMAWHARQERARKARAAYYASGKNGTSEGAPIWRPKWYGELGNDAEFREATKPRTEFKERYYAGGHRMVIDGVPVRVAAYVKDWAPWMKRALGRGTPSHKDDLEAARQMKILFGVKE